MKISLLVVSVLILMVLMLGGCAQQPTESPQQPTIIPEQTAEPANGEVKTEVPDKNVEPEDRTATVIAYFPQPDELLRREGTISVIFDNEPEMVDISIHPHLNIAHVSQNILGDGTSKFVFYPAQPFEEDTIYEVTVTYGPNADVKWRFGPYDLFNAYSPFPTDDDVSIDTPVYVSFMRGSADSYMPATLILKPGDEISQVTAEEFGVASVQLNASIIGQLTPDTTYTAILSYSSDTCCIVWEFTTSK